MVFTKQDWQKDLLNLLRRNKRTIVYSSQNVMSRRIEGEIGGEEEFTGFRTGIFYFKLSTLIDQKFAADILWFICIKCRDIPNFQIATLFLNDPLHRLIYPRSMVRKASKAYEIVEEYYENYAEEYEQFSGVMEHLFPQIDMYERTSYPKNIDLCVIFTDRFGIEIHPDIQNKIARMQKNWLYICVDKDRPLEILEMPEVMEGFAN